MLKAYQQKYKDSNHMMAIRALTYFEDIDFNTPVKIMQGKFEWKKINKRLQEMVIRENDVFRSSPLE